MLCRPLLFRAAKKDVAKSRKFEESVVDGKVDDQKAPVTDSE